SHLPDQKLESHSAHDRAGRIATRSILRRERPEGFKLAGAKSLPRRFERHAAELLLFARGAGAIRYQLGDRAGSSLSHRNSPVSRHWHILDGTHRGDSQTAGRVNRRRTDESTLVRRHPRGWERPQPVLPPAVRGRHTEQAA